MHFKEAKGILSSQNGINIYMGCTHGCIYCDSRSRCYNMNHDFEDVEVKSNAVELLEDALRRKRNKCMIGTGAMTDPYMHIEEKLQNTRRCLELIDRYGFGLAILTKSDMIMRDMDLLTSINRKTKCVVQMTLTTYDEALCRIVEPNVCTTRKRFDVLMSMKKEGIPTVVWLCPILPFINDTEENLRGILEYCFEAGVKGIISFGTGLTLREGNREYFYSKLDEHFPGLKQEYIKRYGNSYEIPSPRYKELNKIFHEECSRHKVMHDPEEIFTYLRTFEDKLAPVQLKLF